MTTDLVERLSSMAPDSIGPEAANEIIRLRRLLSGRARFTEVERLRAELADLRLDMAQLRDELEEARA